MNEKSKVAGPPRFERGTYRSGTCRPIHTRPRAPKLVFRREFMIIYKWLEDAGDKKGAKRYSFNYTGQDDTVVFLECVWTGLNEL